MIAIKLGLIILLIILFIGCDTQSTRLSHIELMVDQSSTVHYTKTFDGADMETVDVEHNTRLPHDTTLPNVEDAYFLGWYYDEALTQPFT